MARPSRWLFGILVASVIGILAAGCSNEPKEVGQVQTRTDASGASVRGVELHPSPAQANNRLEAKIVMDPFADTSSLSYVWRRNGVRIAGEGQSSLDPGHFTKGDEITVEVHSPGRDLEKEIIHAATTRIENTPPKILGASTFMSVKDGPEIYVRADCMDPDKDEVRFSYRWLMNDDPIEGQSGPSLDPSLVRQGARVSAEVVASDGESASLPFTSEPITIDNRPPRITSTPPGGPTKEGAFRYRVQAEDADSDSLTYELVSAPKGMTIDKRGGVSWTLPPAAERAGLHTVKIKVTDSKGASATQEFTLSFARIQPASPQAPTASPGSTSKPAGNSR